MFELDVRYKKNRQKLEQQKSLFGSKDVLHTCNKMLHYVAEQLYAPCQYCGSVGH